MFEHESPLEVLLELLKLLFSVVFLLGYFAGMAIIFFAAVKWAITTLF